MACVLYFALLDNMKNFKFHGYKMCCICSIKKTTVIETETR